MSLTGPPAARIVLSTFGSFGDLYPYIAIGKELQRRGHLVVLATHQVYREKIEAEGLGFAPVRPDLADLGDPNELIARIMHRTKGPETVVRDLFAPRVRESYQDLFAACKDANLLLSHPLMYAAPLVAQKLGIRWAGAALAPLSFFSAYDPPDFSQVPWLKRLRFLGPGFWRHLFRLTRRMCLSWVRPVIALRKELGLPRGVHPVFEDQFSPYLNLALFSPSFAAPQPDWPANTVATGFPIYDHPDDSTLSPDLQAFLENGEPPIVFTLGSSAVMDAGRFYLESTLAAERLGQRAVLLIGSDPRNRPTEPLPQTVIAVEYAPHSLVFPRASVVVHQGGIGTTAQALRSGRPMLILPYSHDQPDNADHAKRLGVARVIARERYRRDLVARELHALTTDPDYAERAEAVGRKLRSENGVSAAADAMEAVLTEGPAARRDADSIHRG